MYNYGNGQCGLAVIKTEGAPVHPDEMYCDMTQEQRQKQLDAYNRALELPQDVIERVYGSNETR